MGRTLLLVAGIATGLPAQQRDGAGATRQRSADPAAADAGRPAPTYADLKYGPYDRNVMDVWLAPGGGPTPVLVSIHGGGFRQGNKNVEAGLLERALAAGISVVAITYRLSDEALAPAQFYDAARAIQFIRHRAAEWNVDPRRIAATGSSAGAGLSLWLGFHDDLADPSSSDPVLRQSTRLTAMAIYNGQSTYDPRVLRTLFPESDVTYRHPALSQLFGMDPTRLDDLPEEKYRLFEQVSALTHLTRDDAPVLMAYASEMDTPIADEAIGIHHPRLGRLLQERMDALGIEATVHTGVERGDLWTESIVEFVRKHFGMKG